MRAGGGSVYFNLIEPVQTEKFVRHVRPGHVLFDIGANVGYYTLLGSRLVGTAGIVVAVEPTPRNVAYLWRHLRLNNACNTKIIAAACSDEITLAHFHDRGNASEGHLTFGPGGAPGTMQTTTALVPAVTVDMIVDRLGVAPDVIKLDVEGAELAVLKGASQTLRRRKPEIFLSAHTPELRKACLALLADFGYQWERLDSSDAEGSEFLATG